MILSASVLYSRSDIVALVQLQPPELQPLLIACIWFFSRSQSSLIENNRYGLLQIDLNQAQAVGFTQNPNDLLNPELNIQLAAQLLTKLGLVQFAGRELAPLIPQILALADYLARQSKQNTQSSL